MPKLLSTANVAEHFAVSTDTVIRWIKSGRLKAINVGSACHPRYRIQEDSLSGVVVSSAFASSVEVEQII